MKKRAGIGSDQETYDLFLWSCNHTSRFPHNHRYVLGKRIERHLYGLPAMLIQAKYQEPPMPAGAGHLDAGGPPVPDVAGQRPAMPPDPQFSYGFATKSIDEIGRLVGGWLRRRGDEKS